MLVGRGVLMLISAWFDKHVCVGLAVAVSGPTACSMLIFSYWTFQLSQIKPQQFVSSIHNQTMYARWQLGTYLLDFMSFHVAIYLAVSVLDRSITPAASFSHWTSQHAHPWRQCWSVSEPGILDSGVDGGRDDNFVSIKALFCRYWHWDSCFLACVSCSCCARILENLAWPKWFLCSSGLKFPKPKSPKIWINISYHDQINRLPKIDFNTSLNVYNQLLHFAFVCYETMVLFIFFCCNMLIFIYFTHGKVS